VYDAVTSVANPESWGALEKNSDFYERPEESRGGDSRLDGKFLGGDKKGRGSLLRCDGGEKCC